MKRFKVEITRTALAEAQDATAYITRDAPDRAAKWLEGLLEAINGLKVMPERYAIAREAANFPELNLRQLIYKSHRIIYAVSGRTVSVLHVRHAAMRTIGESDERLE